MLAFLAVLQYLTMAFWIGGMAAFLFVFSPLVFKQLTSRAAAGGITGAVLTRLDAVGLICSGIMLVITLAQAIDTGGSRLDLIRSVLVVGMLLLTLLGATTIRTRLAAIRSRLPAEIDEAGPDNPDRREYGKWHGISMAAFLAVIILGAVLIALSALRYPVM